MPMQRPPHPGTGLRDDIEALGHSVAEVAKALGGSANAWLRLQAAHDLALVRQQADEIRVVRISAKVA